MYEARNLSLFISKKPVLHNVSLSLVPGSLTAIAGPNGAGKSTLTKVMSGELEGYDGEVRINGKNISKYSPKALSLVRSVMPQSSHLYFSFPVEQVVGLSRYAHRSTKEENQAIINEVMDLTGVASFSDRNYHTLSGGEKQRVQLARVIAQVWEETVYPRYILLDEPTSSLDIAQQQFMLGLVKRICSRGIGVVAVVHDLNLAIQFADQLCFMREGEIVVSGNGLEVFTESNIERTFACKVRLHHDPSSPYPFMIPEREIQARHPLSPINELSTV